MKITQQQLPLILVVCLLSQGLYTAFSVDAICCTTREILFGGTCAAVAVSLMLWGLLLLGQMFPLCQSPAPSDALVQSAVAALLCFLLLCGMAQAVLQQVQFYYRPFGTGALWILLAALLVCVLHCTPHALLRCARLLAACCGVALLLSLLGLVGHSSWQNLSAEALTTQGVTNGFWAAFGLYPEYLALFICPSAHTATQAPTRQMVAAQKKNWRMLLALPFFVLGVQAGAVLCSELVFGVQQAGVGGFEFLRSWAFLSFSRFDGVVVLVWLLLSLFRLQFLAFLALQISPWQASAHSSATTPASSMKQEGV